LIFRIAKDGTGYQVLMDLPRSYPSELIEGTDGRIYGTTVYGGTKEGGRLYSIEKDGTDYREWYSFAGNGGDGVLPSSGLTSGPDGMFFGVTLLGGLPNPSKPPSVYETYGTLYQLRPQVFDERPLLVITRL
jgi:hypothetical protein